MPHRHPRSEDDIEGVLAWTVIRAGRQLERLVTDHLLPYGLTAVQFGMLAYLSARPGMNQSELARAVQVRPQSARETASVLITRGLLRRTGPEGRGHRSAMYLTDDGLELLARVWPIVSGIDGADIGLRSGEDTALNQLLHAVLRARSSGGNPECP